MTEAQGSILIIFNAMGLLAIVWNLHDISKVLIEIRSEVRKSNMYLESLNNFDS